MHSDIKQEAFNRTQNKCVNKRTNLLRNSRKFRLKLLQTVSNEKYISMGQCVSLIPNDMIFRYKEKNWMPFAIFELIMVIQKVQQQFITIECLCSLWTKGIPKFQPIVHKTMPKTNDMACIVISWHDLF